MNIERDRLEVITEVYSLVTSISANMTFEVIVEKNHLSGRCDLLCAELKLLKNSDHPSWMTSPAEGHRCTLRESERERCREVENGGEREHDTIWNA